MSCPLGVNTGFIQLAGPISQTIINSITVKSYPLSISFAPRKTVPSLIGNKIDETTDNTCTYKGRKFSLIDVQICAVLHSGYITPTVSSSPAAELIMSFAANNAANDLSALSGILLCIPIYSSGYPSYNTYLEDIINRSDTATVSTLESLFYQSADDITQHSLSYKTCFETVDASNTVHSKGLYAVIFPQGIHLTSTAYQALIQQLGGTLPSYMIPPAIRNANATVKTFRVDTNGAKIPDTTSPDGIINIVTVSTSTDDFKNHFEYFTLPPRLPTGAGNQQKYFKTTQYKCVPFNQFTDLSGTDKTNTYVIPGNKSLDTILEEQKEQDAQLTNSVANTVASMSVGDMEEIAGGVVSGVILVVLGIFLISRITK